MTAAKRVIGISKKISLAKFGEGWDDCYVSVRPADMDEQLDLMEKDLAKLDKRAIMAYQFGVIKSHFLSGRVKVLNSQSGEYELQDMKPEDVKVGGLPMVLYVYRETMGLNLDPKETPTPAEPSTPQS